MVIRFIFPTICKLNFSEKPFLKVNFLYFFQSLEPQQLSNFLIKRLFENCYVKKSAEHSPSSKNDPL